MPYTLIYQSIISSNTVDVIFVSWIDLTIINEFLQSLVKRSIVSLFLDVGPNVILVYEFIGLCHLLHYAEYRVFHVRAHTHVQ